MKNKGELEIVRAQATPPSLLAEFAESGGSPRLAAGSCPRLWIAVNQLGAQAIRERVAIASRGALLAPGISTFDRLAEKVLTESRRRIRPISKLGRRRILAQVISDDLSADRLDYFAPVANTRGFLVQVDRLITDLKRRTIWPEQFAVGADDRRRRELAQLYAGYQRRLHEGNLYDSQGRFWAAGDELERRSELLGSIGLCIFDGFTDFTGAQHRIIDLLLQRTERMVITLPIDGPLVDGSQQGVARADLFARSLATWRRLRMAGDGSIRPYVELVADEPPGGCSPAIAHLARTLFAPRPRSDVAAPPPDGLQIIAASGDQDEAVQVARAVKQLLVAGAAPGDIVIAYRRLAGSADRWRGVLADYGIPADVEVRAPLATSPTVRTLLTILRLHAEDWPYRELLRVAEDLTVRLFGAPRERIALEKSIREAQIPRGRQALLDLLQRWAERTSNSERVQRLAAESAAAHAQLSRLSSALEKLPQQAGLRDWVNRLAHAAAELGIELDNDDSWLTLRRGLITLARADQAAGFGPEEMDARRFARAATDVAIEEQRPGGHSPVGRVRVVEAETVRGLRPRRLFLAGLSEQSFPQLRNLGDLESNSGAAAADVAANSPMAAAVGETAPQVDPTTDEMLLFYRVATRPTESLTFSYPALDAKAQRLEPSPYLADVERAFAPHKIARRTSTLAPGLAADVPLSRTEARIAAIDRAQQGDCAPLAALVRNETTARAASCLLAGVEIIGQRALRDEFGAWEGVFTSDAGTARLAALFGPEHHWSPSQLETYASCPFRFFGETLLRLTPLPDLTLTIDPRHRGSLLHEALAAAHRRASTSDDALGDAMGALFTQTLEQIVGSFPQHGLEGALREIQRRELTQWAEKLDEQTHRYRQAYSNVDRPLEPRYFEVQFGPGSRHSDTDADAQLSTQQPFGLDLGNEKISLTGQIDRLDVGQVGQLPVFNVIDYKSGVKAVFKRVEAEAGAQLQLPLYALAAEELLLKGEGAVAWAAGYWSVQGDGFVKSASSRSRRQLQIREEVDGEPEVTDEWKQLRVTLIEKIQQLVHGVRAAQFPVYNPDENCTRWCELSKICRIAHIRSLEKGRSPESGGKGQS